MGVWKPEQIFIMSRMFIGEKMKKLKIILGVLISLIFIIIAFNGVNFHKVIDKLMEINYFVIIPAVVIQLMSYWVRTMRWSLMLRSIKRIKPARLFPVICISYLANNVLPLRAGEFVRAYLLGQKEEVSKTAAFSTVILERIYDGITLVLFFGVIAFIYPFPSDVKLIGAVFTAIFLGALLFSVFIVLFREKTLGIINFFIKFLPGKINKKVYNILVKLIDGFDIIRDKRNLFLIALYSIAVWLMEACLIFAIASAFGFTSTVYLAFITLVLTNFFIMIPSSPGYIGTFEEACRYSLSFFKIGRDTALSFALIYRAFQYIPITVLGFVFLFKEGLSLSSMTSMREDEKVG